MMNWKNPLGKIVDQVRRAAGVAPKNKGGRPRKYTTPEEERAAAAKRQAEYRTRERQKHEEEQRKQQEQAETKERERKECESHCFNVGQLGWRLDKEGRKHCILVTKVDVDRHCIAGEEVALDADGQPRKYSNGAYVLLKDVESEPVKTPERTPAPVTPVVPQAPMVMPFGLENVPAETDYIFLCPEESGAGEVRVYGFPVIWFDKWDDRFCELPQLQAVKHWFVIFNRAKHADTPGHLRQFITSFASSPWAQANCRYDAQSFGFAHGDEIQTSLKPTYTRLYPHDGSTPSAKSLITLYAPLVALPTDPVEIEKLIGLPPRPRGEYVPDFGFGGTGWMPPSDWEPPKGSGSGGTPNDGSSMCM